MTLLVVPGLVCALIGLTFGTLLSRTITRTPMRQRALDPAWHCSTCGVKTTRAQGIPWLARCLRKNNCMHCSDALWPNVPKVEIAVAVVLGITGARTGFVWHLPVFLLFSASALAVAVIDARNHMIPNRIVYPTLFAALVLLIVAACLSGDWSHVGDALIGMTAAWLFFAFVWVVNPRGIGFGDVRLSALIGLVAGWVGLGNVVLGVLLGLVLGAFGGTLFVIARRGTMKDPIPFGPFLVLGGYIAIFFGSSLGFENWI